MSKQQSVLAAADYDGDEVTTYGPSDDEDAAAAPSASPNSAAARKARMESESEESTATKTGSQPSSPDVRETAVIAEEAAEVVAKVEGAVESDSEVQLPLVESEVPIAESAISQKAPDTEGETSVEPREALEQLTVRLFDSLSPPTSMSYSCVPCLAICVGPCTM